MRGVECDTQQVLVLMTGLPGTGKSTIANAVARALGAVVVSADPIDGALETVGVDNPEGRTGYAVMKALVGRQLDGGLDVVVDAVNPFRFVRDAYAALAASRSVPLSVIVTGCSDVALHRSLVEMRVAEGRGLIVWAGVERQIAYYEPFDGPALRVDAADGLETNCARAIEYVTILA
jgi:predicted kinase